MISSASPSTLAPASQLCSDWQDLIAETDEMLSATADVVAIRIERMAAAGPLPDDRDRAEFSLMGREKPVAAFESVQAMFRGGLDEGMAWAAHASRQIWAASAVVSDLLAPQSLTQRFERQAALSPIAAASAVVDPFQFALSTTRVMQDALAPIHRCVTANSRRLKAE